MKTLINMQFYSKSLPAFIVHWRRSINVATLRAMIVGIYYITQIWNGFRSGSRILCFNIYIGYRILGHITQILYGFRSQSQILGFNIYRVLGYGFKNVHSGEDLAYKLNKSKTGCTFIKIASTTGTTHKRYTLNYVILLHKRLFISFVLEQAKVSGFINKVLGQGSCPPPW